MSLTSNGAMDVLLRGELLDVNGVCCTKRGSSSSSGITGARVHKWCEDVSGGGSAGEWLESQGYNSWCVEMFDGYSMHDLMQLSKHDCVLLMKKHLPTAIRLSNQLAQLKRSTAAAALSSHMNNDAESDGESVTNAHKLLTAAKRSRKSMAGGIVSAAAAAAAGDAHMNSPLFELTSTGLSKLSYSVYGLMHRYPRLTPLHVHRCDSGVGNGNGTGNGTRTSEGGADGIASCCLTAWSLSLSVMETAQYPHGVSGVLADLQRWLRWGPVRASHVCTAVQHADSLDCGASAALAVHLLRHTNDVLDGNVLVCGAQLIYRIHKKETDMWSRYFKEHADNDGNDNDNDDNDRTDGNGSDDDMDAKDGHNTHNAVSMSDKVRSPSSSPSSSSSSPSSSSSSSTPQQDGEWCVSVDDEHHGLAYHQCVAFICPRTGTVRLWDWGKWVMAPYSADQTYAVVALRLDPMMSPYHLVPVHTSPLTLASNATASAAAATDSAIAVPPQRITMPAGYSSALSGVAGEARSSVTPSLPSSLRFGVLSLPVGAGEWFTMLPAHAVIPGVANVVPIGCSPPPALPLNATLATASQTLLFPQPAHAHSANDVSLSCRSSPLPAWLVPSVMISGVGMNSDNPSPGVGVARCLRTYFANCTPTRHHMSGVHGGNGPHLVAVDYHELAAGFNDAVFNDRILLKHSLPRVTFQKHFGYVSGILKQHQRRVTALLNAALGQRRSPSGMPPCYFIPCFDIDVHLLAQGIDAYVQRHKRALPHKQHSQRHHPHAAPALLRTPARGKAGNLSTSGSEEEEGQVSGEDDTGDDDNDNDDGNTWSISCSVSSTTNNSGTCSRSEMSSMTTTTTNKLMADLVASSPSAALCSSMSSSPSEPSTPMPMPLTLIPLPPPLPQAPLLPLPLPVTRTASADSGDAISGSSSSSECECDCESELGDENAASADEPALVSQFLMPSLSTLHAILKPGLHAAELLEMKVPQFICIDGHAAAAAAASADKEANSSSSSPATVQSSLQEVHSFCLSVGYPVYVKGVHFGANLCCTWSEVVVAVNELHHLWRQHIFVQQCVTGFQHGIAFAAWRGEYIDSTLLTKTISTSQLKGWSGVLTDVPPTQLEAVRRFITSTSYTGGAEIEFIETIDGDRYLIDFNPRFPAWIYASALSGINLPGKLVQTALHHRQTEMLRQQHATLAAAAVAPPHAVIPKPMPYVQYAEQHNSELAGSGVQPLPPTYFHYTRTIVEVPSYHTPSYCTCGADSLPGYASVVATSCPTGISNPVPVNYHQTQQPQPPHTVRQEEDETDGNEETADSHGTPVPAGVLMPRAVSVGVTRRDAAAARAGTGSTRAAAAQRREKRQPKALAVRRKVAHKDFEPLGLIPSHLLHFEVSHSGQVARRSHGYGPLAPSLVEMDSEDLSWLLLPQLRQPTPKHLTVTSCASSSSSSSWSVADHVLGMELSALTSSMDAATLAKLPTPCFLLSSRTVSRNIRMHQTVWSALASSAGIAQSVVSLSVKTQPSAVVLRQGLRLGAYAECISMAEVQTALAIGYEPAHIIVNGPAKFVGMHQPLPSQDHAQPAPIKVCAMFADSMAELTVLIDMITAAETVKCMSSSHSYPYPITTDMLGIRLCPIGGLSRFGVRHYPQLFTLLAALFRSGRVPAHVKLAFHFHYAASAIGVKRWVGHAMGFVRAIANLERLGGRPVAMVDFGGGWTPHLFNELHTQALLLPLLRFTRQMLPHVQLVCIEPGKAISERAGALLTTVQHVRELTIKADIPIAGTGSKSLTTTSDCTTTTAATTTSPIREGILNAAAAAAVVVDACICDLGSFITHPHPVLWFNSNQRVPSNVPSSHETATPTQQAVQCEGEGDRWTVLQSGGDTIFGRICMEWDKLGFNLKLPPLQQGSTATPSSPSEQAELTTPTSASACDDVEADTDDLYGGRHLCVGDKLLIAFTGAYDMTMSYGFGRGILPAFQQVTTLNQVNTADAAPAVPTLGDGAPQSLSSSTPTALSACPLFEV